MNLKASIGLRIKELRQKIGYTQEELSCLVGVDSKSISRIETGVFLPSLELISRMASVFNVKLNEMFIIEHHQPEIDLQKESIEILKNLKNDKLKLAYKMLQVIEKD